MGNQSRTKTVRSNRTTQKKNGNQSRKKNTSSNGNQSRTKSVRFNRTKKKKNGNQSKNTNVAIFEETKKKMELAMAANHELISEAEFSDSMDSTNQEPFKPSGFTNQSTMGRGSFIQ